MGGGYYDRDVGTSSSSFSADAARTFTQCGIHADLDPKRTVTSTGGNPIIVCVDVTGSMGDWTKIIFDKMPMFFGQLMMQGYLADPELCFAAVGDAFTDSGPLQVTDFAKGTSIDSELGKLWLEGNGGGQSFESYELAAFYFAHRCDVSSAQSKPFLFMTGDEGFYDVSANQVKGLLGVDIEADIPGKEIFRRLRERFHVYLLHKPYHRSDRDAAILRQWEEAIGAERVLHLERPKACVDIMLGAIALQSGSRSLDRYVVDLRERGQDDQRIDDVNRALGALQIAQ
eukprot:gnl/Trimastix_PCT/393.p1 GENE.gnl/Trimastix_PCT/393~~gnl/Trimastix_PCT/393.p1  ORF type:complete len:286 (-),score=84.13 gnl/Trimastix_PCT/393:545-1402(-)